MTTAPSGKRRGWLRTILTGALALMVLLGGAWLWLTAREAPPAISTYRVDLGELRALASSLPGAKPAQVRSALIAETALPRAAVFAGESFAPHPMVHQVFQLVRPDGTFVLVDAGMPPDLARTMDPKTVFHDDAWAAVQRAFGQAQQIVVTHEHLDHVGGIVAAPPGSLPGRLQLTAEQLGNTRALDDSKIPAELLQTLQPLTFERTKALAPGIVLQKAPGHTPGSQLVFVQTEDGREYLFVGDVAWHMDQLRNLHYRPRLVTQFFLGENRAEVLSQFRTLHDLMEANPNLIVVVSHDRDQRGQLLESGRLLDGLSG